MPELPIVCDMSTATDTPSQRLGDYRRLFERSLLRRERREDGLVFTFRPGSLETVEDLSHREAACCPFLDYRVETVAGEVVWTITGDSRQGVVAVLEEFFALPDRLPSEQSRLASS